MAEDTRVHSFTYDAFISYRHVERDRKWAAWLIEALERYQVPKALQDTGSPPRLSKIFRDEEELLASSDLNDEIKEALKQSRFLIVVCSAFTPRSRWVQREIEIFNELGRGDQVLALLTEGEPGDSFPAPLLEHYRETHEPDGTPSTVKEEKEPLAADVRPRKDLSMARVKRLALLRLVARLLDVAFDDLRQRDRERRRRRRFVWATAVAVLCLLLGGSGFGYWDLVRPHTAYFRHLEWKWGVPEGLRPLDEETRGRLETDYRIITRDGKVVEARRENSAGSLSDDKEGHARWLVHYGEDGRAERIELFDHSNRLMREDVFKHDRSENKLIVSFEHSNIPQAQESLRTLIIDPLGASETNRGGKSEITRHELAFDDNGVVTELRYQDSWGTPHPDAQGSFGQRFEYAHGLVTRRAEIGDDDSEITLRNGVRAVTLAYDRDDNLIRHTIIGSGGRPVDGPDGYAYYIVERDHWGNDVATAFYSIDGKPTRHRDGYARLTSAYDARGNTTENAYYGLDGKRLCTRTAMRGVPAPTTRAARLSRLPFSASMANRRYTRMATGGSLKLSTHTAT
jgi:hypothetical protein